MTTGEVRERAARLLEERGWCQGCSVDSRGRVCLIGALAYTAGLTYNLCKELRQELQQEYPGENIDSLACWNDAQDRTISQVLALLRGQPIPGESG